MSHIPNSAMPHAVPSHEPEVAEKNESLRSRAAKGATKVADKAREHPKTAIAAGAAVAVGALAAAAIPLVRAKRTPAAKKPAAKAKKG